MELFDFIIIGKYFRDYLVFDKLWWSSRCQVIHVTKYIMQHALNCFDNQFKWKKILNILNYIFTTAVKCDDLDRSYVINKILIH